MFKKIFAAIKGAVQPIDPIIVYQMGKVGSKTIEASLHDYFAHQNIRARVYHTHNLVNLDEMEKKFIANKNRPNAKGTLAQIRKDAKLKTFIDKNPKQKWNLISLVRDPVAQNVGSFFHVLKEFIPDWKQQYESGSLDLDKLQKLFIDKYPHLATKRWFETQMQPMWDIDIYAVPFDKERGFMIYRSERADLLLIRLEDLNECASQAFDEFLNFKDFKLVNANIGDEKEYKELYTKFKAHPLPVKFIESMYDSHFMRHFYSDEETIKLKKIWLKQ